MFNRRAVFLDRDGTVIKAIYRPDANKKITAPFSDNELEFVPRVYPLLYKLKEHGFLRILATNQPDVANGYVKEDVWQRIHKRVVDTLGLDDVFMCRHTTADNCPFKKPSPMMLLSAADKWGIDLSRSWMIGDTSNDTEAGRRAGCKTIMISQSYNLILTDYDYKVFSLTEAVELIISQQ